MTDLDTTIAFLVATEDMARGIRPVIPLAVSPCPRGLLSYIQAVRGYRLSHYRLRRHTPCDFERAKRID